MSTKNNSSPDKGQLKLTLLPEVVERLKAAAAKTGKNSAQEVVMELIAVYLPVWVSVEEAMSRAMSFQYKQAAKNFTKNYISKEENDVESETQSHNSPSLAANNKPIRVKESDIRELQEKKGKITNGK